MSRPGNRSRQSSDSIPVGFPTKEGDGTIQRANESAVPLGDPPVAQSPPFYSETPRMPDKNGVSSSATFLGGDYFQSRRPETFHAGDSFRKEYTNGSGRNRRYPRKEHRPRKQFLHLLGTGFLRFLVTAGLVIGLWQIIWAYSKIEVLNLRQKRIFNFLVTAFSLALGLNLASSLKSAAAKARWWIISWKRRPLFEVEMILRCHALTEVFVLGCKTAFTKPSIAFKCALWLLINLATQVFVACLGLNWSLVSAVDSSSAVAGDVLYQNLTQFYFGPGVATDSANQVAAHLYGDLALNYNINKSSDASGRLPTIETLALYSASNSTDFWDFDTYSQHVFMDFPADRDTSIGRFYSNRSIITEASCTSYSDTAVLQKNGTVTLGINYDLEPNSTVYWIQHEDVTTCGIRCAKVFAIENRGTQGAFFDCNVTVGNVINANPKYPAQLLSDDLALMAAQSIAVTGYGGSKASSTDQEYTYYDPDFWGTYLAGNHTAMEYLLRLHAIGTVVGANWYNSAVDNPMPAFVPDEGVTLNLDHPGYIGLILGGIGAFHAIFFILAAWLSNKVIVVNDSYLAIALLMRPVVERLNHGSLMSDKDICRTLNDPQVTFGTVDNESMVRTKTKHLEISEVAREPSGGWEGWYD